MARPKKTTVDYFPHYCQHKKTMYILEQRYGNDGYAFWFKLLELLGDTEGHYINCNNEATWEFLQAKTRLDSNLCHEILNLLAKLDAIDPELWAQKVVWSQNFVDGIADVYKNRRTKVPSKPYLDSFYRQKPRQDGVSTDKNPQSKVKESKEKKTTTTVQSTVTGTPGNGQAAAAINFFEQNIGILSPLVAEKLNAWIDDTEESLVLFALEKAILAGKHNFSYAEGILRNWANQGIRTRHAAEMAEREFQRQKEQSRHPPPGAKKHPEDRPLTPEEKKRLEELNIELAKIGKEMNFSP